MEFLGSHLKKCTHTRVYISRKICNKWQSSAQPGTPASLCARCVDVKLTSLLG